MYRFYLYRRCSTPNQKTCLDCNHFTSHCVCVNKRCHFDYDQWKYDLHTMSIKPRSLTERLSEAFSFPPPSLSITIKRQLSKRHQQKPMNVGTIQTNLKCPPVFAQRPLPMCRDCFMVQQLTGVPTAICERHWKFTPEIQTHIFEAYRKQWLAYHQDAQFHLDALEKWRKNM